MALTPPSSPSKNSDTLSVKTAREVLVSENQSPCLNNSPPSVPPLYGDCVSLLVICPQHDKVALFPLQSHPNPSLWFPTSALNSEHSYLQCVDVILQQIGLPPLIAAFKGAHLMKEIRNQIDKSLPYVSWALFALHVKPTETCCCATVAGDKKTQVVWIPISQIAAQRNNLAGSEPLDCARSGRSGPPDYSFAEYSVKSMVEQFTDYSTQSSELVLNCFHTEAVHPEEAINKLYSDFVQHCYPCKEMSYGKFEDLVIKSGLVLSPSIAELRSVFDGKFDTRKEGFLDFTQLVMGLVAHTVNDSELQDHAQPKVSFLGQLVKSPALYPIEPGCKVHTKWYQLNKHYIVIAPEDGSLLEVYKKIPRYEKCAKPTGIAEIEQTNKDIKPLTKEQQINILLRKIQFQLFQRDSVRVFPKINAIVIETVRTICAEVRECFRKEARVLRIDSPCYVIGSLHGNMSDLARLDALHWRMGPDTITENYLLLGDYISKKLTPYSLDCLMYLFCLKLTAPDRIHLIRGHMESRAHSEHGFLQECMKKYPGEGNEIWQDFCSVFEVMPLAAIVENKIFCTHSGIPGPSVQTISQLESSIPLGTPDGTIENMMWSNVLISTEEAAEWSRQQGNEQMEQVDFFPNTALGSGYYFTEKAVKKFLLLNGLSHVIQTCPCISMNGFSFHVGGQLISVYCSSSFDVVNNKTSMALVKPDDSIQIIQID